MFRRRNHLQNSAARAFLSCWFILALASTSLSQLQNSDFQAFSGGREAALANSLTASISGDFGMFVNPGLTGFFRQWQLAAGYTQWVEGQHQASVFYSRRLSLKNPLSDHIVFAVAADYQRIASAPGAVSISDAGTAGFSIGMPLSALSNNISVGANFKYFQTGFDGTRSRAFLSDAGVLYRSPRFAFGGNGLFEHALFSAGLAMRQTGSAMLEQGVSVAPKTAVSAGVGAHLGKENGLQVSILGDYLSPRDQESEIGVGAQVRGLFNFFSRAIGQIFAFQVGYRSTKNSDGRFSAGMSLYFDGATFSPLADDKSLRLDLDALGAGVFSSPRYHASAHVQPKRPQSFRLRQPEKTFVAGRDTVRLEWQRASNPDLYSDTNFLLLLARDDSLSLVDTFARLENGETSIQELIQASRPIQTVSRDNSNLAAATSLDQKLEIYHIEKDVLVYSDVKIMRHRRLTAEKEKLAYHFQDAIRHGDYFWSVVAYNSEKTFRLANTKNARIARFTVKPDILKPDLNVKIEPFSLDNLIQKPEVRVAPIYFPARNASLTEEMARQLETWVVLLRNYPSGVFELAAHADVVNSRDLERKISFNAEIALQRARQVKAHLMSRGISSDQLVEKGYSEEILQDASVASLNYCRVDLDFIEDSRGRSSTNFASVIFENKGERPAENFLVSVYHSEDDQNELGVLLLAANPRNDGVPPFHVERFMKNGELLSEFTIQRLAPGRADTLRIPVDVRLPNIVAYVDRDNRLLETDERNNWYLSKMAPSEHCDLAIEHFVNRRFAFPGDTLQYTIRFKNNGPALARNFEILNVLSSKFKLFGFNRQPDDMQADTLRWHYKFLPPGGSGAISFNFLADHAFGAALNINSYISDANDFNTLNNADKTRVRSPVVRFPFKESQFDGKSRKTLEEIADILKGESSEQFEIAGFASIEDVPEKRKAQQYCANLKISKKRAKAVREFLISKGVDPEILVARGYGHNLPRRDNDSEKGRAKNRRVEIRVLRDSDAEIKDCSK